MRYFRVDVKSDCEFSKSYYAEADNFVSSEEIREYVAQLASIDAVDADSTGELENIDVLDPVEISDDDALELISDVSVRQRLLITNLNNMNNVILGVYAKVDSFEIGDPECFMFSADAGQDAEVTAIGTTRDGEVKGKVFFDSWVDCIQQLKRYWRVSGVAIASGTFVAQRISNEEYDMEINERELVIS